ncbi:MAG: outer membrane beta-barrel family protein [Cyclobacteriaceae bacterium]
MSRRKAITTVQSIRAGTEVPIAKNSSLGFLFTASMNKWDMNALTHDINHAAADSSVITDMKIREVNNWRSATGGINFQSKPGSKSDITVDLDYIFYTNNNPSDYNNAVYYPADNRNVNDKIDVSKHTPMTFVVGKFDYVYNLTPTLTVETGLKGVLSRLDNKVRVSRWNNDSWMVDPVLTSDADLTENIGAAYFSAKWQSKKGVHLSAGMRYEHTHTYISTSTVRGVIDRRYGNFFPSVFIKKDIDKEKDISFSYSRRITRPTFRDIAPFVFFWSPNTFSSGNTSLWPSISDGVRAGYHSGPWILILQYNHSSNEISFFQPEIDNAGNLIYKSQNLRYLNTLNFTNSFSFNVAPWWEVQTNFTGQYQTARTNHLEPNASLSVYNVNINVSNQVKLTKDFLIEISGFYQSRSVFGISEFMPLGSLNAGIQKKFGNNGILRLAMDDIFYNNYWRVITNLQQINLKSSIKYDWHNQFVRLTYSRTFGNGKLRTVQVQTGSEEERSRAN